MFVTSRIPNATKRGGDDAIFSVCLCDTSPPAASQAEIEEDCGSWCCILCFSFSFLFLPQIQQMTTRCYGYWTTSGWESQSWSSKSDIISTHTFTPSLSPPRMKSKTPQRSKKKCHHFVHLHVNRLRSAARSCCHGPWLLAISLLPFSTLLTAFLKIFHRSTNSLAIFPERNE